MTTLSTIDAAIDAALAALDAALDAYLAGDRDVVGDFAIGYVTGLDQAALRALAIDAVVHRIDRHFAEGGAVDGDSLLVN